MTGPTSILLLLAFAAVVAAIAWAATGLARRALIRHRVHDAPNERSLHTVPKPRGGGAAVIAVALLAWIATGFVIELPAKVTWIMALGFALSAISFVDDVRGLPPAPRFAAQLAAVVVALAVLDPDPVFQGLLPVWLDRVLAGFLWLWFINLFNFMDGIDGISGVETISVGGGLTLVALAAARPEWAAALPLAVAASAAGFLVWNWAPSKIFLGDCGSIALGFLLGWLLLDAAAAGLWAVALILPAYYLMDSTFTLVKRSLRAEKVWQAHKEHAYQRAVAAGWSHARTAGAIAAANVVLVGLAMAAVMGAPAIPLVLAAVVAIGLMWRMPRGHAR